MRGDEYPAILLSPESLNGNWGKSIPEHLRNLEIVTEVIDVVHESFPIDVSRQYLTGLSAGGFGTWNMISLFPIPDTRNSRVTRTMCGTVFMRIPLISLSH